MRSAAVLTLIILTIIGVVAQSAPTSGKADLVVINGKVWTVNPQQPEAQALAVVGLAHTTPSGCGTGHAGAAGCAQ